MLPRRSLPGSRHTVVPAARPRRAAVTLLLACTGSSACGGLVEHEPTPPRGRSFDATIFATGASDGSTDAGAADAGGSRDVGGPPYFLCGAYSLTPMQAGPDADVVTAVPNPVYAHAGSYGFTQLVAAGPWLDDPVHLLSYDSAGATIPTVGFPSVVDYGTTQHLQFLVPADAGGQQGIVEACATNGIEVRTVRVFVEVGPCVAETQEVACNGLECGAVPDGCTGTVSCGSCSGDKPYCYENGCIPCEPVQCSGRDAFFARANKCGCFPCGCEIVANTCVCFGEP